MQIRPWGTRGSIPSPGPATIRYGGNTSCVEVRLDDGTLIILDAGTGIRPLGTSLGGCQATVLLSHYHWDHIQGFPFFGAGFDPNSAIAVYGPESEGRGPQEILGDQMTLPYFPASPSQLHGIKGYDVTPSVPFRVGGAEVHTARLSHPGVTLGYRIEHKDGVFVYISDDEVDAASPQMLNAIVGLAEGADLLLHDTQYAESEYAGHRGWGHSTPRQSVCLARKARVRRLLLFHHDPSHNDETVEAIAEEARALAGDLEITIGCEGETIAVGQAVAR